MRTRFLEIFEDLVVLSAQLGPFCKLVLAAGCVEFLS